MELWPYRLAVRTPGSHPGNPGSIPGGVTRSELERKRSPERAAFLLVGAIYCRLIYSSAVISVPKYNSP